jgi:uncharacterized phage-associated protein
MNTPVSTKAIANAIWQICQEQGHGRVSPMKLQKLVYFAHGWHLAYTGLPLIPEEIEAWDYGPVIETLYRDLKHYGSGEITALIPDVEFHDMQLSMEYPNVEDSQLRAFLGNVVGVYGKFSPIQLSNMTHMPNTPWARVKSEFPWQRSLTIPNELIKDHFQSQIPKPA